MANVKKPFKIFLKILIALAILMYISVPLALCSTPMAIYGRTSVNGVGTSGVTVTCEGHSTTSGQ